METFVIFEKLIAHRVKIANSNIFTFTSECLLYLSHRVF